MTVPHKIYEYCPRCSKRKQTIFTYTHEYKQMGFFNEYLYTCNKCDTKIWKYWTDDILEVTTC